MTEFRQYRRTQIAEMVPWVPDFNMEHVSVSAADRQAGSPKQGDMIARNPKNHADQWLVSAQYFADNFESPSVLPQVANDNFSEADLLELERAVNALVAICHKMNKHWWTDPATGEDLRQKDLIVPTKLLLMVSEICEAMEADRKDLMDDKLPHRLGLEVELADALIRIGDLGGALKLNLGAAAREKSAFNLVRPDHKAENRVKKGGKKY